MRWVLTSILTEIFSPVGWSTHKVVRDSGSGVNLNYSWFMPKRSAARPAELAGEGVDWIDADLSYDISAEYSRLFAKGLRDEMQRHEITARSLSKVTGISHTTIGAILHGRTVPDLGTVALLEKALKREILPAGRLRT